MEGTGNRDGNHVERYAAAIRAAREMGDETFQSWFNRSQNVSESIIRGFWDFGLHVLTPTVCEHLACPEEKTVLEIGYGGGRMLNAACCFFKEAMGVDIHREERTVEEFLRGQGKTNFRLIRSSGKSVNVESEMVDLVYSFIVLQHLPTFEVFVAYLKETFRCLRPGGLAQLYFGRYQTKLAMRDRIRHFFRGYKEIPDAPVNYTSLVVRVGKMKRLCRRIGFTVLETGTSYKRVPDGFRHASGGQSYVTLLKPARG